MVIPSIIQKTYSAYLQTHLLLTKVTKHERYVLGTRIENSLIDLHEYLLCAYKYQSRRQYYLQKADSCLVSAQFLLKALYDTRCIDQKSYVRILTLYQEIGRMLGGWEKSLTKQ